MNLLENAYDLHVHTAPDITGRRLDDFDMAERARSAGMKGFAIKCHQFQSGGRAALVRRQYPEINAVGGITLNNSVGGLNPMAVEMAARMGSKIVWLPTVNSMHQKQYLEQTGEARPYGAGGVSAVPIQDIPVLVDGALSQDALDVLDVIRQFDLVLATGHISPKESVALIRAGHEMGVKKMIATHVSFPMTSLSMEEQQICIACGAVMEQSYYTCCWTGVPLAHISSQIREAGCHNVILSTDMGQSTSRDPVTALNEFAERLIREGGFTEREIHTMVCDVPTTLVE